MVQLMTRLSLIFLIASVNTFAQSNAELQFRLDSLLVGDSIIITAKLPSCGEFGHHTEEITIKKNRKGTVALLKQQKPCQLKNNLQIIPPRAIKSVKKQATPIESPVLLTPLEIKQINQFLTDFSNYKVNRNSGIWNTYAGFTVRIPNNTTYVISDETMKWDQFTTLKNSLFQRTDKSYAH